MKKMLWLLPVAILALTACSKDDDNKSDYTDNKVAVGSQTLSFNTTASTIEDYETQYNAASSNYYIGLALSNNYQISLDLVLPTGTTNPSHDYSLCTKAEAEDGKVWAFVETYSAYSKPEGDDDYLNFASGTVNVAYNTTSEVYTITINGKLTNGTTVKGRYKGELTRMYHLTK